MKQKMKTHSLTMLTMAALVFSLLSVVGGGTVSANSCYLFHNQGSQDYTNALQYALNLVANPANGYNSCVTMDPGVFTISNEVGIPAGVTLQGAGRNLSGAYTSLKVAPSITIWAILGRTASNYAPPDVIAIVTMLVLDGSHIQGTPYGPSQDIGDDHITIDNVLVANGLCNGVTVAGPGVTISNSAIEYNGTNTAVKTFCPAAPGAGIYMEGEGPTGHNFNPVIYGTEFAYNIGPAIDDNEVNGGQFHDNYVHDNNGWAAISLYQTQSWNVYHNTISQPEDSLGYAYHPSCKLGPSGYHSAGVRLCEDQAARVNQHSTNNNIHDNYNPDGSGIVGPYGIILVGSYAPIGNSISGNGVIGSSTAGCADDASPGQNTWTNNNCLGTANTPPTYF